jgi:hypothetical protein
MLVFGRLLRPAPLPLACAAALGALALLWYTRDAPLQPVWFVRIDALGSFFCFATFAGLALTLAAHRSTSAARPRSAPLLIGALSIAYLTTLTPAILAAYALLALPVRPRWLIPPQPPGARSPLRIARAALRQTLLAAPGPGAGRCATTIGWRGRRLTALCSGLCCWRR